MALIGLLGIGKAKPGQGVRDGGRGWVTLKARAGIRQCGRVGSSSA